MAMPNRNWIVLNDSGMGGGNNVSCVCFLSDYVSAFVFANVSAMHLYAPMCIHMAPLRIHMATLGTFLQRASRNTTHPANHTILIRFGGGKSVRIQSGVANRPKAPTSTKVCFD